MLDLTGQKFGRLTAIKKIHSDKHRKAVWECVCECGNVLCVISQDLKRGHTQSCGCLQKERTGNAKTIHGMKHTRLYNIWLLMKQRCSNPNNSHWDNYGGRGIRVCDKWLHDFQAFYDWAIANGYADNLSIDREDVNGNYCPENCRWITMQEQATNKTNSIFIEFEGETKTISEWSKIKNINYSTMLRRYHEGRSINEIFNEGRLKHGTKSKNTHIPRSDRI